MATAESYGGFTDGVKLLRSPRRHLLTCPNPPTMLDLEQIRDRFGAGFGTGSETRNSGKTIMASRDNQTMQIFVIVLALLSLLLSVGLFMVNNARKTAVARAKSATEESGRSVQAQGEAQSEANSYKTWIGFAEADNYQGLQKTFAEDMKQWGNTFDEPNRAYRTILENIFEENRKLAQSEADAKKHVKDFKQKLLATEAQKNLQIAQFEADYNKAQEEKASQLSDYNKSRQLSSEEKDKIVAQLAEQRKEIEKLVGDNETSQKELQDKFKKMERVIEILESKQAIPDPYAQPADGRISWVDQREGKVWINLGEKDHLRPQVTFSVYSGDANDVNAAVSKGSIEVVRLLGTHMAEARITSDKSTRPLMEGDKVYSQVWNRGRQIGFAITGVIDLNNDGSSDLDQLERIIQLNNGKIDAVPDDKGDIQGQMTVDTRYLILGKHPEGGRVTAVDARKSFQKMSAEADTLNIEVLTLDDFLGLMGWVSENRAIKLGAGARSEDFPARTVKDREPPTMKRRANLFRPRKPQPSY